MTQALDIQRRTIIAAGTAAGLSQVAIGDQLGLDNSTVSRHVANPLTQALIQQAQARIAADAMDAAVQSTVTLAQSYQSSMATPNDVSVSDRERIKIDQGGRIVRGLMQSIGILPTHSPSLSISILSQTNIHLSAAVTEALATIITPHSPGHQEPDPEDD